jgi:Concanavalin A-like lectin/glucanases superfamily
VGRFGNPDTAYRFDGADDYIDIGASIISTDTSTYSVWAKRAGTGLTVDTVLCNWSNNDGGPALIDWGVKKADEIRILSGRWYSNIKLFSHPYASDEWTNIVLTRNGTGASFHINGDEIDTADNIPAAHSTDILHIGRYHTDPRYFNGLIDDIRIYNRVLTADEIAELVNSPLPNVVELLNDLVLLVRTVNNRNGIKNNSLEAKLNAALNTLDDTNEDNNAAAIHTLGNFIRAVARERDKGNIASDDAQQLIDLATQIIGILIDG